MRTSVDAIAEWIPSYGQQSVENAKRLRATADQDAKKQFPGETCEIDFSRNRRDWAIVKMALTAFRTFGLGKATGGT
jgi:hypothetical protein